MLQVPPTAMLNEMAWGFRGKSLHCRHVRPAGRQAECPGHRLAASGDVSTTNARHTRQRLSVLVHVSPVGRPVMKNRGDATPSQAQPIHNNPWTGLPLRSPMITATIFIPLSRQFGNRFWRLSGFANSRR